MGKFKVRELAQARNLTQEDLSHQSGVKISTVRRIWQNRGADDPRVGTLKALAAALGVAIEELYNPEYSGDDSSARSVLFSDTQMSLAA